MQLPEFIQQYSQRLSGHLNEAQFQLQQFQVIADMQFQGSLAALITRYESNSDAAIAQTGTLVGNLSSRVDELSLALAQLQQPQYWQRISYFVTELNADMAQATAQQFLLAIPLTLEALITGVSFALVIMMLKSLLSYLVTSIYHRIFTRSSEITQ